MEWSDITKCNTISCRFSRKKTHICHFKTRETPAQGDTRNTAEPCSPSLICSCLREREHRRELLLSCGKLCLVMPWGGARAQSARTNNYCTEDRGRCLDENHLKLLILLNPQADGVRRVCSAFTSHLLSWLDSLLLARWPS